MFPVSSKFLSALQASHTPVSYIEVWSAYNGQKLLDVLPFVTASVSVDSTAEQRRALTVNFTDAQGLYVPQLPTDYLAPFGQELRPYRGIKYADGTTEYVPLGRFPLTDTGAEYSGTDLPISLTAPDRAQLVQAAKTTDFYTVAAGTNIATAVQALINARVSGLTYNLEPTAYTTPGLVLQPGDDPWKAAVDLAASAGQDLSFDASGIVVSRTIPNPDLAPVSVDYPDGDMSVTTKVSKSLSVTGTFNVVVVTGEGPGVATPVTAISQDNNPSSPTYVGGPLGQRVKVIKSDQATTVAQAQAIADAELNKALGLTQQVGFTGITNPATDAFDVITVESSKLYVTGRYVVDKVTIPLEWSSLMQVTTRARLA
jgi:hypothetical protein